MGDVVQHSLVSEEADIDQGGGGSTYQKALTAKAGMRGYRIVLTITNARSKARLVTVALGGVTKKAKRIRAGEATFRFGPISRGCLARDYTG